MLVGEGRTSFFATVDRENLPPLAKQKVTLHSPEGEFQIGLVFFRYPYNMRLSKINWFSSANALISGNTDS